MFLHLLYTGLAGDIYWSEAFLTDFLVFKLTSIANLVTLASYIYNIYIVMYAVPDHQHMPA